MSALTPGNFCWHDLMSTDPAGSLAFYGELFGWTQKNAPMAEGMTYGMLHNGDLPFGGIVPLDGDDGPPTHWTPYILVENADDSCARAVEIGGGVCVPPTDIGHGIFAVVNDPQGGFFSVWQAKGESTGMQPDGSPGFFCWYECLSTDAAASAAWYGDLFGWRTEQHAMNVGDMDMTYHLFFHGDRDHAGAMDLPPPAVEQGARTHWLCYVAVDDVDASSEKAAGLGAAVLCPCTDIPGVGRFCVIQDPQGGMLALFKGNAEEGATE